MVLRSLSINKQNIRTPAIIIPLSLVIGIILAFDVQIAILIVLALPVLFIIIKKPFYGLLFFLCLVPIESLLTTSGGSTWLRYLGIGIFIIWIGDISIRKRRINFRWPAWFYLIYVIWSLLSISWAVNYRDSLQAAMTIIQLSLLFIVFIDQVNTLNRLKWALTSLVLGGMMAVITGYSVIELITQNGRLVVSDQAALTLYAYPLGFSMILFGIMSIMGKGKIRLLGVFFFILCLFPVIATGYRGVLVTIVVGLACGFFLRSKSRKKIFSLIIILLLLYFSFNYFLNDNFLPVDLISHYSIDGFLAGSGRWVIWKKALEIFTNNPLLGLGLNQFRNQIYFLPPLGWVSIGTHNDYIDALVNLGIPGFMFLILGEGSVLFSLYKIKSQIRSQDLIWYSFLVALFVATVVGQNFVNLFFWKYSWIIRALIIAAAWNHIWKKPSNKLHDGKYEVKKIG